MAENLIAPRFRELECFLPSLSPGAKIASFDAAVPAGFPSPAEDFTENRLDLNELLIRHPAATFFVRAAGSSMTGAGIHPGDILVVDRSLEAAPGKIVVAAVDGEYAVKRLKRERGRLRLVSEAPGYPPIELPDESELRVFGVVTHVIHSAA